MKLIYKEQIEKTLSPGICFTIMNEHFKITTETTYVKVWIHKDADTVQITKGTMYNFDFTDYPNPPEFIPHSEFMAHYETAKAIINEKAIL